VLFIQGKKDYNHGIRDPARDRDFKQFLEKNFVSVKSCEDSAFTPAVANDVDVIVVDGDIRDHVPADFHRPMVLLGSDFEPIGIPESRGYKLRNSCRYLTEKLYSLKLDHPIFRGPLPVTPTLNDEVNPNTGKHVRTWKAWSPFKGGYRDFVMGILVDGVRLRGAEDSEIISGGMSFYGDEVVALAREANFFIWGLPASPSQMTEEAQRVFVNTIVYMKQFDGATQTVWRNYNTRNLMPVWFNILKMDSKVPQLSDQFQRQVNVLFPPQVVKAFGADVEKYLSFYRSNIGYLYVPHGTNWYTLDEEARSVGVPNYDVAFIKKCIELLRLPTEAAKAKRLLERYTWLSLSADDRAWQEWFEKNCDKLYFSDYYDYHFYTGPAGLGPAPTSVQSAIQEIKMVEPSEAAPVSVGAAAVGDARSAPVGSFGTHGEVVELAYEQGGYVTDKGNLVTLVIRLKIADGWHVYARSGFDRDAGGQVEPTNITVILPSGARWYGDWQSPSSYEREKTGIFEYRGDIVFSRQLYFARVPTESERDVQGRVKVPLRGTVRFESCGNGRCFRPYTTVPFEARIIVQDR